MKEKIIGIYGISSQSGLSYLADFLNHGYDVIGYAHSSEHGKEVVSTINEEGGLWIERPKNSNNEETHFVPLVGSIVTHDVSTLLRTDIIVIALPSIYHVEVARHLFSIGICEKRIPLVLSPSRSFASPYLWQVLGDGYPIICLSTCPYSCKIIGPNRAYLKRRKRTYVASVEGDVKENQEKLFRQLFYHAAITRIPALTSLNNIGAVFHCATYILNYEEIKRREQIGEPFSFYIEGIANRKDVGLVIEQIDQVRLQIASKLGLRVFGLKDNPREDIWRKLTNALRALEEESSNDIEMLRRIRREFTEYLNNCVISAAHWLDLTYGVQRIEGECLSATIGRTPTYKNNSVPQRRYVDEDIPTGLVVYEALANRFNIDCKVISDIIKEYNLLYSCDIRVSGRNLSLFDFEYICNYLKGNWNYIY